jgi:hypothetical protein
MLCPLRLASATHSTFSVCFHIISAHWCSYQEGGDGQRSKKSKKDKGDKGDKGSKRSKRQQQPAGEDAGAGVEVGLLEEEDEKALQETEADKAFIDDEGRRLIAQMQKRGAQMQKRKP